MQVFNIVKGNKLLVAILLMAAVLRFAGTKPGYNQYHADEGITYSAATSMVRNGNLDPLRYDYPALVPLINYVFFKSVFIPVRWLQYYLSNIPQIVEGLVHIPIASLEKDKLFYVYVLGERHINALFWGRYVTAFFSLGNVFLTYLLAKKLFNKKVGLLAAFLLTFNYKHVVNSHIGLPDIYNAFFLLLSIYSVVKIWERPTKKNYLVAGLVSGLFFSIKYQFFAFIPIIVVYIFQNIKHFKNIFIAGLTAVLVFVFINPYHLLYLEKTIEIVKGVSQKYGMGANQLNLFPFSYLFHVDYGPLEFVLVFIGLLMALRKFTKQSLLLLTVVIPFFFVFTFYSRGGFYVRNFITTTPLLLTFAAVAIWQIGSWVKNRFGSRFEIVLYCLALPIVVFIPARNSIINSYYYTKEWGYDILRPWLSENLPADVVVATHPFDARSLNIKNKHTEFEHSGAFSLNEHKEDGATWAIIDLNWAGQPFYFWMSYGLKDISYYWNKPLNMMRNTYSGLAMEEQFRYQIYSVTKPWQAPDTHLIVAKYYDWPKVEMKEIKRFEFDDGLEEWSIYGKDKNEADKYVFDDGFGYLQGGSLVALPGVTRFPGVRISSKVVPINVGHIYKVSGYLKVESKLEPRERDGFIRVDFYGENPELEKVGIISSVSSRVYGTDDWFKKEVTERAPEGSKYMIVSFQTANSTRIKIWLDDLKIEESISRVEDVTQKPPYDLKPIDLNYVYPNSQSNL